MIWKGQENPVQEDQLPCRSPCARSIRRIHSRDEYTEMYLVSSTIWVGEIGHACNN